MSKSPEEREAELLATHIEIENDRLYYRELVSQIVPVIITPGETGYVIAFKACELADAVLAEVKKREEEGEM